jgi:hypothetical protein
MIFNFWILAIAFAGPMQCPDRRIDVSEQKCSAEMPEVFFYMSKEKALSDYSVLPIKADRVRLFKVEVQWPKNRFSSEIGVEIFNVELRPVKSYEVTISTRQVLSWRGE